MNREIIQRIVLEAKEDPNFFHSLVFEPEKILNRLDYLDRKSKSAVVSIDPASVVASLFGSYRCADVTCACTNICTGGNTHTCTGATCAATQLSRLDRQSVENMAHASCGGGETCSCTSGTCGDTCGGSTCSVTCSGDSCGRTCDNSCGVTSNFQEMNIATNPSISFANIRTRTRSVVR